jgi:hypothetical protein
VSIAAGPLADPAGRGHRPIDQPASTAMSPAAALTRGDAALRAAATICLAGIALAQAIEVPAAVNGRPTFAVLSAMALTLCVALALALAAAPATATRQLWRIVAATATVVLAGWAVPRAVTLPGLEGSRGRWATIPAAACAPLAAACLVLSAVAVRPTRSVLRGLATGLAVLLAFGPGVGALVVALGPGPTGGENAIVADVHVHAHSTAAEPDIVLRRGAHGNHYMPPVSAPTHAPAFAIGLVAAAAVVFVYGAVGYLRRRSIPSARVVVGPGADGGLT